MYDVVIIGAGASGLMAAREAALEGRTVLVAEKMEKAARKIRITGKGRCNLTNMRERADFLAKVRANPEFLEPSYAQFDNRRTVTFFKKEGVQLTTERGERVFPTSGDAWEIADALRDAALDAGAEISFHTTVKEIVTLGGKISGVRIMNKKGFERFIECRNVIVATGGMSYPATGSTGDGYVLAHSMGHEIVEVRPSLVALQTGSPLARALGGLRLKNVSAELYIDGEQAAKEFGELEFSNRGIDGPVILRMSRMAVDALLDEKDVKLVLDIKSALSFEVLSARIKREIEALEREAAGADEAPGTGNGNSPDAGDGTGNGVSPQSASVADVDSNGDGQPDDAGRESDFRSEDGNRFRTGKYNKFRNDKDNRFRENDRSGRNFRREPRAGDLLRKLMPKPMVDPIAKASGISPAMPLKAISDSSMVTLVRLLKKMDFTITGHGGFDHAIVTAGGVDVKEIDPQTLESKLVKGLYFAGEVLDIDADTGGYNLQIAFSTGKLAGKLLGGK